MLCKQHTTTGGLKNDEEGKQQSTDAWTSHTPGRGGNPASLYQEVATEVFDVSGLVLVADTPPVWLTQN